MFLYVFWDAKFLVCLSNTIVNLLFLFCHDLRKGVFKAVLATVFQRCLSYSITSTKAQERQAAWPEILFCFVE